MTLELLARCLTDHPYWSPRIRENTKGKVYVDGVYNSTGRFISLESVRLLSVCLYREPAE